MMARNFFARLDKLRTYGLKGVLEYFRRGSATKRLREHLLANSRRHPLTPGPGLTLVADMTGTGSLSKVMRDLARRLRDADIPYQTFDLHEGPITIPPEDYRDLLTPPDDFRILRYTHTVEMCTHLLPPSLPVKRSRIYFWEFSSGLTEYDASLPTSDADIVAMSDFNRDVFRQLLPPNVAVRKLLYPFVFDVRDIPPPSEMRRKYGYAADDFIVFFNFDFGTSYKRKNPEDALRAFAQALAHEPRARFLFKAKNARQHSEYLAALRALAVRLGVGDRVRVITDYLPQRELYGLTNVCDVYLSLHRGEGFGLGIAEAMSLGKPAIVTDYSSTTEFCNSSNSIPIPCTMVPVLPSDIDNPCYRAVREWAQPDIAAAARALCELFENPQRRLDLGSVARDFVADYFSNVNFKRSLDCFLNDADNAPRKESLC